MAVVISLPWSTSVTASLVGLWLLSALPFLRSSRLQKSLSELRKSLTAPAGAFPVLLWLIAAFGMLWADVSWLERLQGLTGFHKLLVIPLLLVQFNRSARAQYVLAAFLFSCAVLLILSWIFVLWPAVARRADSGHRKTRRRRGDPSYAKLEQMRDFGEVTSFHDPLALGYASDALSRSQATSQSDGEPLTNIFRPFGVNCKCVPMAAALAVIHFR